MRVGFTEPIQNLLQDKLHRVDTEEMTLEEVLDKLNRA